MNYFRFFISNRKILSFLILFTFFSGFGQTFVLSIYIPSFLSEFSISRTYFSTLYSLATILSGTSIIFAGKLIDRVSVKYFALAVIAGLTVANITAGLSFNALSLFFAIFLLRFFGQGLSTHTAFTTAGKYFKKTRGKALSIAYLGFPLSEGIMPGVVISSIMFFGWRETFHFTAIAFILILLPLTLVLLNKFNPAKIKEEGFSNKKINSYKIVPDERIFSQKEIIRNRIFYLIAPMSFLVGFIITALFFFQTFIAEYKGWTIEWMALNISVYAVSSFAFSILAGPMIDRYTARKIFPFIILPVIVGFAVLIFFSHPYTAALYWFFVGVTTGMNSTVSNALYAEIYGKTSLGGVRSLFAFIMIIGTAMGPIIYSLLLDAGLSFSIINVIISIIVMIYFTIIISSNKLSLEL